jgi:hypothetical protein
VAGSARWTAVIVPIRTGKKAASIVVATIGPIPRPNHIMNRGKKVMNGIVLKKYSSGEKDRYRLRDQPNTMPPDTPNIEPMKKPTRILRTVTSELARMYWAFDPKA